MFEQFEGRAGWTKRSIACGWCAGRSSPNIAGFGALLLENLFLLHQVGNPDVGRILALSLSAMLAVLFGVLLLGAGKTAGLLVLTSAGVAIVASLVPLLLRNQEPAALVLATAVAPGVCLAFVAALLHARPIVRFLRGRP